MIRRSPTNKLLQYLSGSMYFRRQVNREKIYRLHKKILSKIGYLTFHIAQDQMINHEYR